MCVLEWFFVVWEMLGGPNLTDTGAQIVYEIARESDQTEYEVIRMSFFPLVNPCQNYQKNVLGGPLKSLKMADKSRQ